MSFTAPQERSSFTGPPATVRAEYPPAAYWRRWVGDAPPPVAAALDAPEPAPGSAADGSAEASAKRAAEGAAAVSAAAEQATADAPDIVNANATSSLTEAAYRVLIVEDDRSQALFAQSVLRNAGMEVQVVAVAGEAMAAIAGFHPDLVILDLHMPGMTGTELIGYIRRHAEHAQMPVVFLTGDTDPERQAEALDSGADDYLRKPVRPRTLIATVQNRIRRARALRLQSQEVRRHPATGLLGRSHMLKRLGGLFPEQRSGAVHFLLVEGAAALRDRYGYAAFDALLTEAGKLVGRLAGDCDASRLNDNTFVVYAPELPAEQHGEWARMLRDGFSTHRFELDGGPLRLRACVGYVDLAHGFADAGAAMAAAEEALRQARNEPIAIAAYQPPREATRAETAALLIELQEALEHNRLELAFQPIVAVMGGEEVQYQTLMRLRGDNGRMRIAGEIMPVAEGAGLVHEIDRRTMAMALSILRDRIRSGRAARLFVPQAARSLGHDGYAESILAMLRRDGIDGTRLVVDVRLDDALIYAVLLREFCQKMVDAGVRLCLSQFRVNSESETLLAQLPLNYLRLSPYYANGIEQPGVQEEMRVLIDRAHQLGLQVIGQHVENPQTAATLWLSGIDYLQGDLVQRAANAMDFDFQHSLL